ncbi:NAD(P)-binding protein [Atractiella rhizophila]|nr:NAD(P)-binding protein [Atractiella rhizophila]
MSQTNDNYSSDPGSAQSAASSLQSSYPDVLSIVTYSLNSRDPKRIREVFKEIDERFDGVDIVIANAGACIHKDALEMNEDDASLIFETNLLGVFWLAQTAAKCWIARKKPGVVLATASISAQIVNKPQRQCFYNASKAGLIQLCKSLAVEWAEHDIRVNTVSPGYIESAMLVENLKAEWAQLVPQKRLADSKEVGDLMVYLASGRSPYMTGSDVVIDGGYT